jgi:uncharacterized protein DUF4386
MNSDSRRLETGKVQPVSHHQPKDHKMTQPSTAIIPVSTRFAGILYLTIAVLGGFSIGYVPTAIVASGDAAQTAQNLSENLGLFRLSLFADLVVMLCEIVLTVLLYQLLRPVSETWSMIAALARFSMVLVMAINVMLNLMPVILLEQASSEPTKELALWFFQLHQFGVYVWGVLFGLHLAVLGCLVIGSGYLPRLLGWMMAIGSLGYLIEGFTKITLTDSALLSGLSIGLLSIVTIGELSFALWLLCKGVNKKAWIKSAPRPA